jgi:hypothetical protein
MKKTAVCVLSRYYNQNWINFLKTFSNYDIYFVVDDNDVIFKSTIHNITVIQVNDDICRSNNYYKSSSWSNLKEIVSWDRALYFFNCIKTDYEYVWFLEEDVFLHNENLLIKIDNEYPETDLLCSFNEINDTGDVRAGWNHWVNVIHRIGTPWAHSLICICRMSRRLLDKIHGYRRDRHLLFIEALFNTLAVHNNYSIEHPIEITETITYDRKWDYDEIEADKIYHPIKKVEDHHFLRTKNM